MFNVEGQELKMEIKNESVTPSDLSKLKSEGREANLASWYACFYSKRFWQYFLMMLLGNLQCTIFDRDFGRDGSREDVKAIQLVTPIIISFLFTKIGFRHVFNFLMLINIAIGVVSIALFATGDRPFRHNENSSYPWTLYIIYRFSIAIEVGIKIVMVSSCPWTFGLKFGSLAMCFI